MAYKVGWAPYHTISIEQAKSELFWSKNDETHAVILWPPHKERSLTEKDNNIEKRWRQQEKKIEEKGVCFGSAAAE